MANSATPTDQDRELAGQIVTNILIHSSTEQMMERGVGLIAAALANERTRTHLACVEAIQVAIGNWGGQPERTYFDRALGLIWDEMEKNGLRVEG